MQRYICMCHQYLSFGKASTLVLQYSKFARVLYPRKERPGITGYQTILGNCTVYWNKLESGKMPIAILTYYYTGILEKCSSGVGSNYQEGDIPALSDCIVSSLVFSWRLSDKQFIIWLCPNWIPTITHLNKCAVRQLDVRLHRGHWVPSELNVQVAINGFIMHVVPCGTTHAIT